MNEHLKEKTANQILHEFVGKCWHDGWTFEPNSEKASSYRCGKCRKWTTETDTRKPPIYDQSLDAIAPVEAKVIETFGGFKYLDALAVALKGGFDLQIRLMMDDVAFVRLLATAPASVRAAAIVALIEEKTK